MSLSFGSHSNSSMSSTQTGPDQQTEKQLGLQLGDADQAAAQGAGPLLTSAAQANTSQQQAGLLGTQALSGNGTAINTLMNPYINNVVNATNAQYDKTGAQAAAGVDSNATSMGAFGGSRNAVATGVAQANNNLNRNTAISGLLSSGYTQAINQASTLVGQGQNATASNIGLGNEGVGQTSLWGANVLKGALQGMPYGTSSATNNNSLQTTSGMTI